MAPLKMKIAVVVSAVALTAGTMHALTPDSPTTDDGKQQRIEQQMEELSDAHERDTDRMRDEGLDGVNDENSERLRPGEHDPHRPNAPRLRIR